MTVPSGATQRYSAGNKVYGAGRSNPTSGPVNPTGYIERELNNNASDRRSGLASAALGRMNGGPSSVSAAPLLGPPQLATTPEGHYLPPGVSLQPRPQVDLSSAILRRLQGGM